MVAAADASILRSLGFLRSISALTISTFAGEVDFDLMGLTLACGYRICSAETKFVNRTLERNTSPGSATPWFLSRLIGRTKLRRLYLNCVTLDANEAYELGIVDHIAQADSIEQEAIEIAEKFSQFGHSALASTIKATDLANLDFATFLEQVGTGFERLPASR